MNYTDTEINRAMSKAKIHLMSSAGAAFLAHCTLSMEHVWDNSVQTAATDGWKCYYNVDFFMKQRPAQRVGLILHEVMHPAMFHFERVGSRNFDAWNEAGDHVNNLFILEAGYELPDGALADRQFRGMTVEQVYDHIMKNGGPKLDPKWKDMKPKPGKGQKKIANDKAMKQHWDNILLSADAVNKAQKAKAGKVPGGLQIYIDGLLKPEILWHRILARFMNKFKKTNYTMRKPNRRYRPQFLLPSQFSEAICDITVAVDTSGSVTNKQFHHFVSETAAIIRNLRPDNLHFIQFDTKIKGEPAVLRDLRDLQQVKFTGRGGTRIDPVMAYAKKKKPSVLIIFSDGEFTSPSIDPKVPVLWITHKNPDFTAPFGKVIHYKFKEAA